MPNSRKPRWTLGSYSRFIKAARQGGRLSVPQARELYRESRKEIGRSLFANDFKKPLIRKKIRDSGEKIRLKPITISAYPLKSQEKELPEIVSLEEWDSLFDEASEYEREDYDGSGSYKKNG